MSAGCWQCDLDIDHVCFHGMRRPGEPVNPFPRPGIRTLPLTARYRPVQYWDSGGGTKMLATERMLVTGGTIDNRKPFT